MLFNRPNIQFVVKAAPPHLAQQGSCYAALSIAAQELERRLVKHFATATAANAIKITTSEEVPMQVQGQSFVSNGTRFLYC